MRSHILCLAQEPVAGFFKSTFLVDRNRDAEIGPLHKSIGYNQKNISEARPVLNGKRAAQGTVCLERPAATGLSPSFPGHPLVLMFPPSVVQLQEQRPDTRNIGERVQDFKKQVHRHRPSLEKRRPHADFVGTTVL